MESAETISPREEPTFRANIRAQDDAVLELMNRFDVPAGDAVRIVHTVAQAGWRRGFHMGLAPLRPATKEKE
jgi:hypothetical protein